MQEKLGIMARQCLNGTAPQCLAAYKNKILAKHACHVSETASRQHLRSAASHQLVVLSYCYYINDHRIIAKLSKSSQQIKLSFLNTVCRNEHGDLCPNCGNCVDKD